MVHLLVSVFTGWEEPFRFLFQLLHKRMNIKNREKYLPVFYIIKPLSLNRASF